MNKVKLFLWCIAHNLPFDFSFTSWTTLSYSFCRPVHFTEAASWPRGNQVRSQRR